MAPSPIFESNAEIRKHYFREQYVIIAPGRNLRPESFGDSTAPHKLPESATTCHFCHNTEKSLWQKPGGKNWQVKVIPNRFPALTLNNPKAYGNQEVIINTPRHDLEFSELPISHIETIFEAYCQRLTTLRRTRGLRYVLVYKNDGPLAGASVAHAHCQILGLPLVPPHIEHEADALNHYWDEHQSCAYCDIINWEVGQKVRIIIEDKHFLALSPLAASTPFQVWFLPRRHLKQFTDLSANERKSLAIMLKSIAARLDASSLSFNYFLQESLANQNHHFLLKLDPRTTKWAGAELGTGVVINPVTPESAALWYRGQLNLNPHVN